MNKKNELVSTIWKMLDICQNVSGMSGSDSAIITGQMLAWQNISARRLEPELSFFNYDAELTIDGWESVMNQLARKSYRYALAFTPIDNLKKSITRPT